MKYAINPDSWKAPPEGYSINDCCGFMDGHANDCPTAEIARLTSALEAAERGLVHIERHKGSGAGTWADRCYSCGVSYADYLDRLETLRMFARKCLAEIRQIKGSKPESGSRENPK